MQMIYAHAKNVAACTECSYMHRMQLYAQNTAMCTECSCMHRMQLNAQNAARCTECSCMQTIQLYAYTMRYMHRKPQYVQSETGNPHFQTGTPPCRRETSLHCPGTFQHNPLPAHQCLSFPAQPEVKVPNSQFQTVTLSRNWQHSR